MNREIFVPDALKEFFRNTPRIALAFSGGCDSAYLMYAAKSCGVETAAYYVHSQFQPRFELEDAKRLSRELGCEMRILETDVLSNGQVRQNSANRCYYCKQTIFGEILKATAGDGFDCVMDGTNASDDASDRPGMRALSEMKVLSPLRMCGITKAQVRELSRKAGLFTWNKPAYACLATRVPAGMEIDESMLAKVERAEERMAQLGFEGFRVRIAERGARLEVRGDQMQLLMDRREDILAALEADFDEITLNLKPRREV